MSEAIVAVEIRRATAADAPALRRLAALDTAAVPPAGSLVALRGGEIRAALAEDGRAVADPFQPTASLVAMLGLYADGAPEPAAPSRAPARPRLRLAG